MGVNKAAAIFLCLLLISYLDRNFQQQASESSCLFPYMIFGQVAYIPVGMILGGEKWRHLLRVNKGRMKWKWKDAIWIVVPSFYFLFAPYVFSFYWPFPFLMIANPSVSPVLQIVTGYAIMSSFYKENQ